MKSFNFVENNQFGPAANGVYCFITVIAADRRSAKDRVCAYFFLKLEAFLGRGILARDRYRDAISDGNVRGFDGLSSQRNGPKLRRFTKLIRRKHTKKSV